jgi:PAS domain S-box-containing protein
VDVLRKPLDRDIVRAKVAVFVELFHAREQVRRHAARVTAQERRAEARTAALLNAALDAIIGMDGTGRITEFNGAAEAMFGRPREEALGALVADLLIPSRLRDAHRAGLIRYLATGESRVLDTRIEVPALRADGTEFPIELAIRRVATDGPPTFLGYASDLTARQRAETASAFLAQASEALASSLDYEATLRTVIQLAVPYVADWCAVDVVGDDPRASVRLVAHVDPAKVALAEDLRRRYPPDPDALRGVPYVLRTGQSELYEDVPDALLEQSAKDAEHLRIMREIGLRSAMIVPMSTRGRTLGAITFVATESHRRYSRSDLIMAEDLARRAAMAIENARLYRATQIAEGRNRFLAEATEALSSSLDYSTTLEQVARLAVPRIADSAAVYRLEGGGAIRLTALAAADAAGEALGRELDAMLPLRVEQQHRLLPRVVRTGQAEVLGELPDAVRETWSPTSRAAEIVRQLAISSYMAVPLVVRGQVLGAVALTASTSGRRFDVEDLALAQELARRAGLAVENAQLYREAQDANRLKDEFLANVSHELRTPLTAILAWTHLLRSGRPEQVARAVDTIERNAEAQARIIEDVLDVSRIVTGKLRLDLEQINLADVVRAAMDTVLPAAEAKEISLVTTIDPAAGKISGDPTRLQQVAWNLLANAIKFTPKGGRVEVTLERGRASVYLRISDTGQGIGADFMPHVFERFRQADSAPTRAQGGLGLGLAIVRHLVELHGGDVSAESAGEGRGATFTVTLPIQMP